MRPKPAGRIVRPLLLAFLATGALSPMTLTAQADTVSRIVDDFPDGPRLRVEVRDGPREIEGRLTGRTDGALILQAAEDRTTVRYAEIDRLWIGDGHLGGRGARTGALVGGGIGFGLGVLGRLSGFGGGGSEVDGTTLLVGAVVALPGALIGAGAGYLHGRQQTDWRLRFETRDGRVGLRAEVPFP